MAAMALDQSPPRFLQRDRRIIVRRLSTALLLSVVAHMALIFGVRGHLLGEAASTQNKIITARLVGAKPMPAPATTGEDAAKVSQVLAPPPAPERLPEARPRQLARVTPAAKPLPAALPLPFDPVFYTWREVDVTAKPQGNAHPPYPPAALSDGISGQVLIEVWLDETGKVDKVTVIEANPPGYFEETTLAHYQALHFAPAMKDGMPRRFRTRFLVEFSDPARKAEQN